MKNVKITLALIPDNLDTTNVGFLKGFVIQNQHTRIFYVTSSNLHTDTQGSIGYYGMSEMRDSQASPWLHLLQTSSTTTESTNTSDDIIFIFYDYNSFRESNVLQWKSHAHGQHLSLLSRAINDCNIDANTIRHNHRILCTSLGMLGTCLQPFVKLCDILCWVFPFSSMMHCCREELKITCQALTDVFQTKKFGLETGNIVLSKLMDLALGAVVLSWTWTHKEFVQDALGHWTEVTVSQLRNLLELLMGSPVGLKLNHALNRTMGDLFLYHLLLWKMFLAVTGSLLATVPGRTILLGFATLGLRVQTAILADILSLATFHVYCIYVYAARLYGTQSKVLVSLWRLLLGQKQNPLRNRMDSFQYTHHQLFVGTLAFTILLFLLPSTALYYVVFTVLRLLSVTISWLLHVAGRLVCRAPLYHAYLYLRDSAQTRGHVHLSVSAPPLNVYVSLKQTGQKQTTERAPLMRPAPWRDVFHSVVTGRIM